ncbi:MAG TPA: response regulator [Bryobacteraceae bacterium]|nr:response regulator [Bryobacteraceae bacterium]
MGPSAVKILIVDDEPSLLKMMSVYLKRIGYDIFTAASTERALAMLGSDPQGFSLAVIDATMPGMRMEELAERALATSPALRVIAASGYPVDMGVLEAVAPGRVLFLHKPFSPEMLAAAVRRMLGGEEKEEKV